MSLKLVCTGHSQLLENDTTELAEYDVLLGKRLSQRVPYSLEKRRQSNHAHVPCLGIEPSGRYTTVSVVPGQDTH